MVDYLDLPANCWKTADEDVNLVDGFDKAGEPAEECLQLIGQQRFPVGGDGQARE